MASAKDDINRALTPSGNTDVTASDIAAYRGNTPELQNYFDQKYDYVAKGDPARTAASSNQRRLASTPGPLSQGEMFPSNIPIQKGNYSGSMIGNVPIFVASELTPYAVFDSRRRAEAEAEAAKLAEIDAFYKLAAPPQTKRFSVQGELNDEFARGIEMWKLNAQENYGDDWATVLKNDTAFNGWLESMRTVARYEDGIVDNAARLQKLDEDGDLVLSNQSRTAINDYMDGVGGLSNPFDPSGHDLGSTILRANVEVNLDTAVNDAVLRFADKEWTSNQGKYSNGIYDVWNTWNTTGMTDEQIDAISHGIWIDQYGGKSDIFTEDDIKERVKALYPMRTKKELDFQQNQFSNSGGTYDTYGDADVEEEAKVNVRGRYEDANGNPVPYGTPGSKWVTKEGDINTATGYDGYTLKRPIESVTAKGATMFNVQTGQQIKSAGSETVTWGEVRNYPVSNTGRILTDEEVKSMPTNSWSYKPMAVGTYTPVGIDPTGEKKEGMPVTVAKPATELENTLTRKNKAGKYESGVPVEEMKKKAEQRNNSRGGSSTPAPSSQGTKSVSSQSEVDALAPGTKFIWTDGNEYVKQ